ncbi:MAG: threonine/serine exporter family protein, partial [Clostridia bacterium]
GMFAYAFSRFLGKFDINFFVRCFCSCAGAAFLALVASSWIDAAAYQPVIIGTLMIFVPGVAITNAIRDFLSGSMLSGICRMMEAFLIAVALAAGAGVVLKLWSVIGGVFG